MLYYNKVYSWCFKLGVSYQYSESRDFKHLLCRHFISAGFDGNSWPDYLAISRDIARHGSNSDFWFTRKMLDLLILNLMFSLLSRVRNLPITNYLITQNRQFKMTVLQVWRVIIYIIIIIGVQNCAFDSFSTIS